MNLFLNVLSPSNLQLLAAYCDEFLVHAVDVEGKMAGVELDLVELLGRSSPLPVTYAGGVRRSHTILFVRS